MKNNISISDNSLKNDCNTLRLIEAFYVHDHLLNYAKKSATYIEGGILLSAYRTHIMNQVFEYSDGLILYFNCNVSVWKKLLHMEYYIKTLVKPEPIEINQANNLKIINN